MKFVIVSVDLLEKSEATSMTPANFTMISDITNGTGTSFTSFYLCANHCDLLNPEAKCIIVVGRSSTKQSMLQLCGIITTILLQRCSRTVIWMINIITVGCHTSQPVLFRTTNVIPQPALFRATNVLRNATNLHSDQKLLQFTS